jgi:hypothetical protein
VSLSCTFMRTDAHHAGAGAPNVNAGGMAKSATEGAGNAYSRESRKYSYHAEWLFSLRRMAALVRHAA